MRGSVSAHWFLPLDSISYTGFNETLEAHVEKFYVSAPASLAPHPKGANYLTVELAGLKEMTQDLADLLGLAIPVNLFQLSHSF